jgi:hypothetical protein
MVLLRFDIGINALDVPKNVEILRAFELKSDWEVIVKIRNKICHYCSTLTIDEVNYLQGKYKHAYDKRKLVARAGD